MPICKSGINLVDHKSPPRPGPTQKSFRRPTYNASYSPMPPIPRVIDASETLNSNAGTIPWPQPWHRYPGAGPIFCSKQENKPVNQPQHLPIVVYRCRASAFKPGRKSLLQDAARNPCLKHKCIFYTPPMLSSILVPFCEPAAPFFNNSFLRPFSIKP